MAVEKGVASGRWAVLASEGNWTAADTHFFGLCGFLDVARQRRGTGKPKAIGEPLPRSLPDQAQVFPPTSSNHVGQKKSV